MLSSLESSSMAEKEEDQFRPNSLELKRCIESYLAGLKKAVDDMEKEFQSKLGGLRKAVYDMEKILNQFMGSAESDQDHGGATHGIQGQGITGIARFKKDKDDEKMEFDEVDPQGQEQEMGGDVMKMIVKGFQAKFVEKSGLCEVSANVEVGGVKKYEQDSNNRPVQPSNVEETEDFTENLRFRDESLTFKVVETPQEIDKETALYKYPTMTKTRGSFKLRVIEADLTGSQIIVVLGENGTGKTTFIEMLAGVLKPDTVEDSDVEIPNFSVSYKAQKINHKLQCEPCKVRNLLHQKICDSCTQPHFVSDVMKPLLIEQLMDKEVVNLSNEELQRVSLCLCLGKRADIYLIDEPSAYLNSEQGIVMSKVIKRFILHTKKIAFVVEANFMMAIYLADRVIVHEGTPSKDCVANSPESVLLGVNCYLSGLEITSRRRDATNYRPRMKEPKRAYYYLDD